MIRPALPPMLLLVLVLVGSISCGEGVPADDHSANRCGATADAPNDGCVSTTEALDRAEGTAHFGRWCTPCHGAVGRGDGITASRLNPPPADLASDATRQLGRDGIERMIEGGAAAAGRTGVMPAFGKTLPAHARRSLATHVLSLSPPSGP
jgi:mono/diheme cytochrome c family protein